MIWQTTLFVMMMPNL